MCAHEQSRSRALAQAHALDVESTHLRVLGDELHLLVQPLQVLPAGRLKRGLIVKARPSPTLAEVEENHAARLGGVAHVVACHVPVHHPEPVEPLDNLPGPRQPGRRQHVVRAPHPTHHEPDPGARLAAHVHLHVPAQQLGDGHPLHRSRLPVARHLLLVTPDVLRLCPITLDDDVRPRHQRRFSPLGSPYHTVLLLVKFV
mmetsp:Transcript_14055/g.30002  ORF Transcript_14055/g.30002 Transcript_14055/m.30002 type:complete len:201 (+) Transcript_14055:126-728(+)